MKLIDLTGKKIGRWTVLRRHPENYRRTFAQWECRCECGTERVVMANSLLLQKTFSCGCWRTEVSVRKATTHGHSVGHQKSPTYIVWKGMRQRCSNPNSKIYKYYGGRGITVCERWNSFENFLADMGERPLGLEIDRINNDGNYEPQNCRWTTRSVQVSNRRNLKPSKQKELKQCA